jgi:DNA-binding protein HU-beta
MRINKSEFINQFAKENNMGVDLAEHVVNNFIWLIYDNIMKGNEVNLSGFGLFSVSHRSPRPGVHPRTGERIQISGYQIPKFKAGSYFKSLLRDKVPLSKKHL